MLFGIGPRVADGITLIHCFLNKHKQFFIVEQNTTKPETKKNIHMAHCLLQDWDTSGLLHGNLLLILRRLLLSLYFQALHQITKAMLYPPQATLSSYPRLGLFFLESSMMRAVIEQYMFKSVVPTYILNCGCPWLYP